MRESAHVEPDPVDELAGRPADPVDEPRIRRCKHCWGTVPAPRRKYCSAFCAARGKLTLQDWRRRRRRAR
jgi:hypothetical protein